MARADEAVAAEPPPEKGWESSAALGFNLTEGNSQTILFTLALRTQREWEKDIWSLGADASYGKDSGTVNNEKAGAFADYKRLFDERLYGSLRGDFLHDGTADLSYRFTLGPNLGYFFIKSDETRLSGEVGPAFIAERQGGSDSQYLTIRFAERYERKLGENAKFWQSAEFLPKVDDFEDYLLRLEVGIEAAINSRLSVRLVGQDNYDSDPPSGTKHNDIILTSSLVYKF